MISKQLESHLGKRFSCSVDIRFKFFFDNTHSTIMPDTPSIEHDNANQNNLRKVALSAISFQKNKKRRVEKKISVASPTTRSNRTEKEASILLFLSFSSA